MSQNDFNIYFNVFYYFNYFNIFIKERKISLNVWKFFIPPTLMVNLPDKSKKKKKPNVGIKKGQKRQKFYFRIKVGN